MLKTRALFPLCKKQRRPLRTALIKILFFLVQLRNYPDKAINVVEVTVHRSKPYICHLIDILKPAKYKLSYFIGGHLAPELIFQFLHNIFNHLFQIFYLNRTFDSCPCKSVYQLIPIERFYSIIFFYALLRLYGDNLTYTVAVVFPHIQMLHLWDQRELASGRLFLTISCLILAEQIADKELQLLPDHRSQKDLSFLFFEWMGWGSEQLS